MITEYDVAKEKLARLAEQRKLADEAIAAGDLDRLFAMTPVELGKTGAFFRRPTELVETSTKKNNP